MRRRLAVALFGLCLPLGRAGAQVTVTVDAAQDAHPISPLIYGMNFPDGAQLARGRIPLVRWGGNSTSRYNYQIDVSNTAADYFFENIPGCWNTAQSYCAQPPSNPEDASGANVFLQAAIQAGAAQLFTLPTIGWVAKPPPAYAHPFPCGCPRSLLPNQDMFDPYDSSCGNCKSGGQWLPPPAATTTSVAIDPAWAGGWVTYLTGRFGPSNGTRIYALDNEPALWSSTHHDVRPQRLGYDELWQRMRDHAVGILAADPTALVAGPAEWGWPNYFCSDIDTSAGGCSASSTDRANHGGEELVAWLLDQARTYEQQNGRRILHYLDLHYYPQGGNPPDNLRSLWDPSYVDPSWINDTIRLLPRMRDWVAQHYPGTKIAISEYDFGHHSEPLGAITYAELLGIFGREGLDAATAWAPPGATENAFGAFMLYRNFDGAGGQFESTSVRATTSGGGVAAFAATGPARMTVVLVNQNGAPAAVIVHVASFEALATAAFFTGSGPTVTRQPDAPVSNGQVSVTLPATSFGMLVVPRANVTTDGGATDGPGGSDGGTRDGGSGDGGGPKDTGSSGCQCALLARGGPSGSGSGLALLALVLTLGLRARPQRE